jgi:soluble lytic murein transglycosylase
MLIRIYILFLWLAMAGPVALYADNNPPSLASRMIFTHLDRKAWDEAASKAEQRHQALLPFIRWVHYRGIDDRPKAAAILNFLQRHPEWPDGERLFHRAAEALMLEGFNRDGWRILQKLAEKHAWGDWHKKDKKALVRHYWRRGEFTTDEQEKILDNFGDWLRREDHLARVDDLLWRGRSSHAQDLLRYIPVEYKRLSQARMALMLNQRGVDTAISAVPDKLQNHPALLFERIRWRARKQRHDGVRELLLKAPHKVPYAEKWWPYRARQARDAMEEGDKALALKLLENHGQNDGAPLAEALWMRGWLQLEFLDKPKDAYRDFYTLYHHVSYPISLSRGAYWAGVAAQRNGNDEIAHNWFTVAAKHPEHFYGQLAHAELGNRDLAIVKETTNPTTIQKLPESLRKVMAELARHQQNGWLRYMVRHLVKQQKEAGEFLALAEFVRALEQPHLAVYVGKRAGQLQTLALPSISHPLMDVPSSLAIEPALALAIMRQESAFNPQAKSRAGATGMMQLMPGTAKLVARKLGIKYRYSQLVEPDYNIQLGSRYLADLLERFDGSYPLAIAAYNAGPGNVERWRKRFGPLPEDLAGRLKWLEQIPFAETRNYVQRVLENLHVYRNLRDENYRFTRHNAFQRQ